MHVTIFIELIELPHLDVRLYIRLVEFVGCSLLMHLTLDRCMTSSHFGREPGDRSFRRDLEDVRKIFCNLGSSMIRLGERGPNKDVIDLVIVFGVHKGKVSGRPGRVGVDALAPLRRTNMGVGHFLRKDDLMF